MSETETETPEVETPVEAPETDGDGNEETPDSEPEEQIEGPGDDQQDAEEAAPAEPSSLAVTQEQERQLSSEVKRHTNAITKILGDDAVEAITCPFCNPQLQGFLYEGDLKHPTSDLQAQLFAVLAPKPSVEYKEMPGFATCEVCAGEGKGYTGSHVPNYELAVCPKCKGFGYLPPPTGGTNGVATAEQIPELVTPGAEPIREDVDVWGSPRLLGDSGRENPNYGKMPQYKDPNYP